MIQLINISLSHFNNMLVYLRFQYFKNSLLTTKKTQNSKLTTQNSKLKTQNSVLTTQNSQLKTHNSKLTTQNPKLKTQNSKLKTSKKYLRLRSDTALETKMLYKTKSLNRNGKAFINIFDYLLF
jgi:serine/threonine-protein kinase